MITQRLEAIRTKMAEAELDALVVGSAANRRYLTGFTGSAGSLVLGRQRAVLLVDSRYLEQAKQEAVGIEPAQHQGLHKALADVLSDMQVKRAGFETAHVVHKSWQQLQEKIPDVAWVAVESWVEELRGEKSAAELAALRKAVGIADEAFAALLPDVRPGMSERELALRLEILLREAGAERLAFDTIVASGVRGALPHGAPTDKLLERGELVTLDFGAVWEGYHSDITRTIGLGEIDTRQREIYNLVLEAQEAGIRAVAPGKTGQEIDAAAREIIEKAGYAENFGHGLGHGVGLQIHEEYPRLSKSGQTALKEGMVFSVEPGVYIPGWGGVRIEDLVSVTPGGVEVLTSAPKELLVL